MNKRGFICLAYVNDLAGTEITRYKARRAMLAFHEICDDLGVIITHEKTDGPSQCLNWLGYTIDSWEMIVKIPDDKIADILKEVHRWISKRAATWRELQVLAGKLAHVSGCVVHARKFMSRILYQLRATPAFTKKPIQDEMYADIRWFGDCARALKGRVLVAPKLDTIQIECDACMTGGGGFSATHFYDFTFPREWADRHHISRLEALNIIVAVRTLAPVRGEPYRIRVNTDNSASAYVCLVVGKNS